MTLKEKFKERLYNQSHDDSECLRIRFENIDKVIDSHEKIADDFAIGFEKFKEKYNDTHRVHKRGKELLEIYKKEKGL